MDGRCESLRRDVLANNGPALSWANNGPALLCLLIGRQGEELKLA